MKKLDLLLHYVTDLHWPLLPCFPNTKKPSLTWDHASVDPAQVRSWFAKGSKNVAALMGKPSKTILADIDMKNGLDGVASLKQMMEKFGKLPVTLCEQTATGGYHLYFKWNPKYVIGNYANKIQGYPGIDFKSTGGISIVTPSVIDGKHYRWDDGKWDREIAEAPEWFYELLQQTTREQRANKAEAKAGEEAPKILQKGERNDGLMSEGGRLRRIGYAEREIGHMLWTLNQLWCKPPLSQQEVRSIAHSAAQYKPAETPGEWKVPAYWQWLDVAKRPDWNCKPLTWTVENIIAKGNFAIIAAETQTSKTLFGLFLSYSLLQGGDFLGKYKTAPVNKILYMGLEDPDRRFNERLADMEDAFPAIEENRFIVHIAPDFSLSDDKMTDYLEALIVEKGFDVVFLDTYQKATPGIVSFDDEKQAVILHRLSNLTRKTGVTLIVLDHVRKRQTGTKRKELSLDDIKGTGGKPQNADCIILMERTPDRKQVKFQSFSKDADVNVRILLDISAKGSAEAKFKYAGDMAELGKQSSERGAENRQKVFDAMTLDEWLPASTIAEKVHLGMKTTVRHLITLVQEERIRVQGKAKATKYCRPSPESD